MDKLTTAVSKFAVEPENVYFNYELARLYENIGQTAAAISFYLRAAERTVENPLLVYECMLKIGLCFERQGKRGNSARGAYEQALCILPKRPEAYYLLARHYERVGDHVNGYRFATQGLELATDYEPKLRSSVEFPGKYVLTFQKAVSAWWWGKAAESRALFRELKGIADQLDPVHYEATQRNLSNLGSGPESQAFHTYNRSEYILLRYQFPGAEKIERNYSQVYQDLFILSMLDGKMGGTYLEIGSAAPEFGNNTKLLEEFKWRGVGIEWNKQLAESYAAVRKNPVMNADALKLDYNEVCKYVAVDGVIDYLQLDCEPSKATYDIMLRIPFDKYKFAVITYEHDDYVDMSGKYRQLSRDFLKSKGYELVVSDVSPDGISNFEDWWAHPELVSCHAMDQMKDASDTIKHARKYMLPRG